MDEAPHTDVPGACTPLGERPGGAAGYPWAFQSAQDACLQGQPKSHPHGFIFQLSVDVCRLDVCFCLNIEDVNSPAIVTTILEQVPTCIYSIKSDTSHRLLLINGWMAVCT